MNKNILVAFGGVSPEHEVSVLSAMQAISALEETNYSLIPLYITKSGRWLTGEYLLDLEHYQDLDELVQQAVPCTFSHNEMGKPVLLETEKQGLFSSRQTHSIYAVLPAFHGSEGENGAFQGTCDMYNLPFAGSGIFASSLGMDKVKAKEMCRAHDIPVVDSVDFYESQWEKAQDEILDEIDELGFPVIVKPVNLGSSIGVERADDRESLIEAVETAFRYDANLLVEKAVSPLMEINCSVLGDPEEAQPSVCERPLGKEETLSFEDKYQSDDGGNKGMASADRVIPADIPDELTNKIQDMALTIFKTFRAAGVARLDFLVNAETNELYFNEINTIPGSFSFYLWKESSISIEELMVELIEIARTQHQRKIGRVRSYETNLLSQKAVQGIKGLKNKES
ncbi:D-alanine--D-alanine ligase [Aliifodinibius sp. S!AR15-10]|uniref:D-alanine--D-alanine ligase family protein n=1 Tax=Aliifodinibius sp. S!AR15-10 TaxID=2950437 RepID=UPI00285C57AB|nr:D-alanine--D-alanine ligase family protein [Aliifodinibius sp. S!AR15-10]MDR8392459.1 D-alanine--D-alanine ligase [Aliifodinibius sp. S!AR15-10]